jgi:hypothetical protein
MKNQPRSHLSFKKVIKSANNCPMMGIQRSQLSPGKWDDPLCRLLGRFYPCFYLTRFPSARFTPKRQGNRGGNRRLRKSGSTCCSLGRMASAR